MIRSLLPLFFLTACGFPNSLFVSDHDKESVAVLLTRAQVEYDRNKLDDAELYASKAYAKNPNNQAAAYLLASVYTSQADLAFLDIAEKIAENLNVSSGSSSSNTQVTDVLGVLANVIGITEADYAKLGTKKTDVVPDPNDANGTITVTQFKDLDVIQPFLPGSHTDTSSPRFKILGLRKLNQAIALLCPFVASSVTTGSSDPRHSCTKVTNSKVSGRAQVHFGFAMAHLLEAIYFNAVLQYSNLQSSSTATLNSNLFKRVTAIQGFKFTTVELLNPYIAGVLELERNINSIFDTTANSMLQSTMVDLRVTSQSLAAIEGFPPSMLSKIQGVLTNIENSVSQAGESKTNINEQTKALKAQLGGEALKKFSASIESYITSLSTAERTAQDTQVKKACGAYDKIAVTLEVSQRPARPSSCPAITT